MNLFQILDINCSDQGIASIVAIAKTIITIIQWGIPIVLIIMGSIDMFKAVSSGDEKTTKEAKDKFIKRLIYAVVAFLIPFIISLIFSLVGSIFGNATGGDAVTASNTVSQFFQCWNNNNVQSNADEQKVACQWANGNTSYNVDLSTCVSGGGTVQ